MEGLPVQDQPGLVRDTKSGAIIYTNKNDINRSKERKRLRRQKQQQVDDLQQQVESLQNEIGDIKQLLINLVEKSNG
jgi:hypothetical protein